MENLDTPFWLIGFMCLSGIITDVLFYKKFDNYTALALFILILDIVVYNYLGTYSGKTFSIEEIKEKYSEIYKENDRKEIIETLIEKGWCESSANNMSIPILKFKYDEEIKRMKQK